MKMVLNVQSVDVGRDSGRAAVLDRERPMPGALLRQYFMQRLGTVPRLRGVSGGLDGGSARVVRAPVGLGVGGARGSSSWAHEGRGWLCVHLASIRQGRRATTPPMGAPCLSPSVSWVDYPGLFCLPLSSPMS